MKTYQMVKKLCGYALSRIGVSLLASVLVVSPAAVWADGSHDNAEAEATDFGKPGSAATATRTIEISMGDNMRFQPEKLEIKQGEVIRFKLKNTGKVPHEMVLGTADEIQEHADMMKKMPNMQHHDANMVRLQPGESGEIIWNFDLAGDFQFVCLMPGHREAGMKGDIHVTEK